jgi:hypothetical protein
VYILIPFYTQLLMYGLFILVSFSFPTRFHFSLFYCHIIMNMLHESSAFSLAHYHEHVRVKCVLSCTLSWTCASQVRSLSHTLSWTWCCESSARCMRGEHVCLSFFLFYLSSSVWRTTMDEDGWKDRHGDGWGWMER